MIIIKRKRIFLFASIILVLFAIPFAINSYVINSTENYIIKGHDFAKIEQIAKEFKPDCILVLGAGLKADGSPNHMLADRLDIGIQLYRNGVAQKLLLSGDNGKERYDEVNAMKDYVLSAGVPSEDIFLDHAGFSTYDSMYRTKAIFEVEKVVVVTQKYHQYRAIYMGKGFGLDAIGVVSEPRQYVGQRYRDYREFLARNKDFIKMIIKPNPTYLGEIIPISGSGMPSHDEKKD